MKNNKEYRAGLMEVYRASFKDFTLAAAQLQSLPTADSISREMALAELDRARRAYSRSRDAFVPVLLGQDSAEGAFVEACDDAVCRAQACC